MGSIARGTANLGSRKLYPWLEQGHRLYRRRRRREYPAVGEIAELFVDAAIIVLCSFISPFRAEGRQVAQKPKERPKANAAVSRPKLLIASSVQRDCWEVVLQARAKTVEST
jgi:adenylylsulfate kinase-like enzyme